MANPARFNADIWQHLALLLSRSQRQFQEGARLPRGWRRALLARRTGRQQVVGLFLQDARTVT